MNLLTALKIACPKTTQAVEELLDKIILKFRLNRFESNRHVITLSNNFNINAHGFIRRGVCAFIFFAIFFSWLLPHKFLYFFFNIILPAFLTIAIAANEDAFSKNGKLYLSYWVCLVLLGVIDHCFSSLFRIIPFFEFARCVFCIWLYHHNLRGAELINRVAFHPVATAVNNFVFGTGSLESRNTPLAELGEEQL